MDLSNENRLLKIEIEKHKSTISILETHIHKLLSENSQNNNPYICSVCETTVKPINKDYCEGVIMETIDGKSYHGSKQYDEEISWFYKTFPGKYHIFLEYNKDYVWKRNHKPGIYDTKDAQIFCNNCILDEELSKGKRTHKIYRCLGH